MYTLVFTGNLKDVQRSDKLIKLQTLPAVSRPAVWNGKVSKSIPYEGEKYPSPKEVRISVSDNKLIDAETVLSSSGRNLSSGENPENLISLMVNLLPEKEIRKLLMFLPNSPKTVQLKFKV